MLAKYHVVPLNSGNKQKNLLPSKNKLFPANEKCDRVITTPEVLITFVDTRMVFLGPQSAAILAARFTAHSPCWGAVGEPLTLAETLGLLFS